MTTKYIKICVDMLGAIELRDVKLDDGQYLFGENGIEMTYCPFCGKELVDWISVARGESEPDVHFHVNEI